MRREQISYLAIPVAVALLFWNALAALVALVAGSLYFLHTRGVFRLLWRMLFRRAPAPAQAAQAAADPAEPTVITLVARAPYELLGVDHEAGTATIFQSYQERVRGEQNDGLKLNKQGRRLTAAKNAMMAQRRKRKQGERLDSSMAEVLENRPVFTGKVVQFKNLPAAVLGNYEVGKEVEEVGLTTTEGSPDCRGRGSHRFVIRSRSGRLLSSSGEGQVAFLPGTRFVILSRSPWQNPDNPEAPPGYTFELEEVA